jgi:predicted Zn-dependent protease
MLRLGFVFALVLGICFAMAWYVSQDRDEKPHAVADPEIASVDPAPPKPMPARGNSDQKSEQRKELTTKPPVPPVPPAKPDSQSTSVIPKIPNSLEDVFAAGQELAKGIDNVAQQAFSLSDDEEIEYGRRLHALIVKQKPMWKSPALLARLERLLEPMLRLRQRQQIPYAVYLLDEKQVNAFSHLGGHLYVTRGLLELQPSDAELETVLGHEIAHVDLKHCVGKLTYAVRASQIGGDQVSEIVKIAYHLIALGYAEEQEFSADAWSYKTMLKLGRSKLQATEFLRRLVKREESLETAKAADDANVLKKLDVQIQNHFRSHPPSSIRLRQLDQLP